MNKLKNLDIFFNRLMLISNNIINIISTNSIIPINSKILLMQDKWDNKELHHLIKLINCNQSNKIKSLKI